MRASVRMTRYLESWGAARPFAHLNHRESVSSDSSSSQGRRRKVRFEVMIVILHCKLLLISVVWNLKSDMFFVAEFLLLLLVLNVYTELRRYLCNNCFCQNLTVFILCQSLVCYTHSKPSKSNFETIFFFFFFFPDIFPFWGPVCYMWFWKKDNLFQPPDALNIYLKCIENKQSLHMLCLQQDFISKEFLILRILENSRILKFKKIRFSFHMPFPTAERRRCACF